MKVQNQLVKFKNQFSNPKATGSGSQVIINQKIQQVIKQKFVILKQMYHRNSYENGYNHSIAYRLIILYLFAQTNIQFNIVQEVTRFINFALVKNYFEDIQKAMDILLIKQLILKVSDRQLKLWRIILLQGLRKYYKANKIKKQKLKVTKTIRTLCMQTLKKQEIKQDSQMYMKILDILIIQQRQTLQSYMRKGKNFQAIQYGNNIIRAIQKAQQSILPKYQYELMLAYWDIANIHNSLHYIMYAKKYCTIALNIAERIKNKKYMPQMKELLESLNQ